jgi:hypothetical protein
MYAVVETVSVSDLESARKILHDDVLPFVQQTPGFVSGHWLAPVEGQGMSVLLFESEAAAQAMADQMQPGRQLNDFVTLVAVEIREVVGTVHQIDDVPMQVTPLQ